MQYDMQHKIDDAAWALAGNVVNLFQNIIRDEEINEATHAVFERCQAGIAVILANRDRMRLKPSNN